MDATMCNIKKKRLPTYINTKNEMNLFYRCHGLLATKNGVNGHNLNEEEPMHSRPMINQLIQESITCEIDLKCDVMLHSGSDLRQSDETNKCFCSDYSLCYNVI